MSVHECIQAYRKLAAKAFTPKRNAIIPARPSGAFSAKALEAAIKEAVREHCTEPECVSRRSQGESKVVSCRHSDLVFRDGSCTKT